MSHAEQYRAAGLLLIVVVVLVLFGRGKISSMMGEVGKGITAFKRGVSDSTAELEKSDEAETAVAQTEAPADTGSDKEKV